MALGVRFDFDSATPMDTQMIQAFLGIALKPFQTQLDRIEAKLDGLIAQEKKDMAALDDQITALTADVTAEDTVIDSAVTLIQGFPALLATAVSQAQAAGATPAQLASFTTLGTTITAKSAALAAAVAAGTPAAGQ